MEALEPGVAEFGCGELILDHYILTDALSFQSRGDEEPTGLISAEAVDPPARIIAAD